MAKHKAITREGGVSGMCSEACNSRPVEVIERGTYGLRERQRNCAKPTPARALDNHSTPSERSSFRLIVQPLIANHFVKL